MRLVEARMIQDFLLKMPGCYYQKYARYFNGNTKFRVLSIYMIGILRTLILSLKIFLLEIATQSKLGILDLLISFQLTMISKEKVIVHI